MRVPVPQYILQSLRGDYRAYSENTRHSLQIEGTKSSRLSPGFVHYTALGTD